MAEALIIASTAASALGAIQQGNAASASAKSQANASRYNAAIQRQNAQTTRQQAGVAEEAHRRKVRQIFGKQRAAIAQSGVGSDNMADLVEQSATAAELDALNIRYEGDLAARGLLADANLRTYEAGVADQNAKAARTAGYVGAAGSLLSGGSGYYKYKAGRT